MLVEGEALNVGCPCLGESLAMRLQLSKFERIYLINFQLRHVWYLRGLKKLGILRGGPAK